jgi:phosphatidylinositol alpha-1,6-mannosyltransferase
MVARAVAPLAEAHPDVVVVFAYRNKTPRAKDVARELEARLPQKHTRFTDTLPDVLVLIEDAAVLLFPVDDLWGKVDLPIVLLEAMQLGTPILALDHGPLAELEGPVKVPLGDDAAFVRDAWSLATDSERRRSVAEAQREYVEREHAARVVAHRYEQLYLELGS